MKLLGEQNFFFKDLMIQLTFRQFLSKWVSDIFILAVHVNSVVGVTVKFNCSLMYR